MACESLYFVNNILFFSLYYLIDFLISLFFYLPNFLLFLSFFHCSFYLNHPFLYWVDYFLPNIYSFSSSNKNFLFIFYALVNSFIFVWAILRLFCSLVISCSNSIFSYSIIFNFLFPTYFFSKSSISSSSFFSNMISTQPFFIDILFRFPVFFRRVFIKHIIFSINLLCYKFSSSKW